MYYKKINLDLRHADINRIKGPYHQTFGKSYHNYEIQDADYLDHLVKAQLTFLIPPDLVVYTEITEEGLICHTDDSAVALNYCVLSPRSQTFFYQPKPGAESTMAERFEDNTVHKSRTFEWKESDLELVDSVSINPNDAYLLNTHQIHSVRKYDDAVRAHIRWVWIDVPYRIVSRSIIEKL